MRKIGNNAENVRKKIKIAIIGGGLVGLSAAHYLSKDAFSIDIFEGASHIGGLASGFKKKNWEWPLEKAYHHIFSNDTEILSLAKQIGYEDFFFQKPLTVSLYFDKNNYRTIPLDTPQDLLLFPFLSFFDRIRAGAVLAFLKFSPFLSVYEKYTSEEFLSKTMGEKGWKVLWEQLFRKKFGKNAGKILTSFIWARITKRTKSLGYPKKSFQSFIDHLANKLKKEGVSIKTNHKIESIQKGERFEIVVNGKTLEYDIVLSTLSSTLFVEKAKNILPAWYKKKLQKIQYMHAVNIIVESDKPFFPKEYWISVSSAKSPIMAMIQHTNFISTKYYGGKHLLYAANYVDPGDKLFLEPEEKIKEHYIREIYKITPNKPQMTDSFLFRAPFAQPLYDKVFIENKSDVQTPVKGLFTANLDTTYPYDRGTNYAVLVGKKTSTIISSSI